MHLKTYAVSIAAFFLIACGSSPGDADIKVLVSEQFKKESAALKFVGVDVNEVVEISSVKVLNKAEDGKNAWVVDAEPTLKFKKNAKDINAMEKQAALSMIFGDFKAGEERPGNKTRMRVIKGDKGWMIAEK